MKPIRKCKYCKSNIIDENSRTINYSDGSKDLEEEIRCVGCNALLWGRIKQIQEPVFKG